eukprot:1161473-Amphidinium_carterae.1
MPLGSKLSTEQASIMIAGCNASLKKAILTPCSSGCRSDHAKSLNTCLLSHCTTDGRPPDGLSSSLPALKCKFVRPRLSCVVKKA